VSRFRAIRARDMIRFLQSLGFSQIRQRGSHRFFTHPDGRTATVPDHRGEDLGRGLVRAILRDIDLSPDDLMKWLTR
jgi:predicted RNA binding protein YcfA (HicA-like mRNA interferase family)